MPYSQMYTITIRTLFKDKSVTQEILTYGHNIYIRVIYVWITVVKLAISHEIKSNMRMNSGTVSMCLICIIILKKKGKCKGSVGCMKT